MCWHIVSVSTGILFTQRFRRKNITLHQYFTVVNCVFSTFGGNYSANIVNRTTIRKIFTVYNDAGHLVRCGYYCCAECQF